MELRAHSDEELLSAVAALCGSQRELTAKLIACLAETEERRLHLKAGFSSLLIATGAVHLSALQLLHDRLTDENHRELLDAASGKSKREEEALLAARFPKPDCPTRIRRLPARPRRSAQPSAEPELAPEANARAAAKPARIAPLSESRFKGGVHGQRRAPRQTRARTGLARDP